MKPGRLNKAPKTPAERAREFRARKKLLIQQIKQQQQEPNAIVEISTVDIRSAGASEDNQVPGPKKEAKTAAERMRQYRKRKKL